MAMGAWAVAPGGNTPISPWSSPNFSFNQGNLGGMPVQGVPGMGVGVPGGMGPGMGGMGPGMGGMGPGMGGVTGMGVGHELTLQQLLAPRTPASLQPLQPTQGGSSGAPCASASRLEKANILFVGPTGSGIITLLFIMYYLLVKLLSIHNPLLFIALPCAVSLLSLEKINRKIRQKAK